MDVSCVMASLTANMTSTGDLVLRGEADVAHAGGGVTFGDAGVQRGELRARLQPGRAHALAAALPHSAELTHPPHPPHPPRSLYIITARIQCDPTAVPLISFM